MIKAYSIDKSESRTEFTQVSLEKAFKIIDEFTWTYSSDEDPKVFIPQVTFESQNKDFLTLTKIDEEWQIIIFATKKKRLILIFKSEIFTTIDDLKFTEVKDLITVLINQNGEEVYQHFKAWISKKKKMNRHNE